MGKKKQNKYPIPPKEFTEEIILSKSNGRLTEKAGKFILLLVINYQKVLPYDSDDVRMDIRSRALQIICEKWERFDPEKGGNAFSYFTSVTRNALFEGMNEHTKFGKKSAYSYDMIFDEPI